MLISKHFKLEIIMAENIFNIGQAHNGASISLHGDMSVAFNTAVTDSFVVNLFTTTTDFFALDTVAFKFRDLVGNVVKGLVFGGRPGLFIELMFDEASGIWYISKNNLVAAAGDAAADTEMLLECLPLPALTPVNYLTAKNYRIILTENAKLANPKNMRAGDRMTFVIVQAGGGNKILTLDSGYATFQAQPPTYSVNEGVSDFVIAYKTGDGTVVWDIRKDYSIIRPLAYVNDFYFTTQLAITAAQENPVDGQTVRVIRDGYRAEAPGTIGFRLPKPLNLRIKGIRKNDGKLPLLRLERTDRAAFGKAIINIEGGQKVVVEDLAISGAVAQDSGNGTGVLINSGADYVLMKNLHIYDCENGVRSGVSTNPKYDMVDVLLENNGYSTLPSHAGQTHSIYAGDARIFRAERVTFYNSIQGHNIKSRAHQTILKQVYARKSNMSRELDIPDQGVMHAFDSVFWKESGATQNNLIGIGHELLDGTGRVQEYFFVNCYFHIDLDVNRTLMYLDNRKGGSTLNTVPVHFIDCEFGGTALDKVNFREALLTGPCTITLTGGPVGPRVPVGDSRRLFNMNERDPRRQTNPTNLPLTPFSELPPMMVTEPRPDYPILLPLEPMPPVPGFEDEEPIIDTTPPTVELQVTTTDITAVGEYSITAIATDNVGVTKVEFYLEDVLVATRTVAPYVLVENFTHLNNGSREYKAIAYDWSNNSSSHILRVEVNIAVPHPRPTKVMSTELQTAYDGAITAAPEGQKRQAAASLLVNRFSENGKLKLYRNGVIATVFEFPSANFVIKNDGHDIYLQPDVPQISKYIVTGSPDLHTGEWWYELVNDSITPYPVISGSVGPAGSGANLELDENPHSKQSYLTEFKFILPRSLDNLV